MEFIVAHWYLWLVVMAAGYGYALFNQIRRMRGMMAAPMSSFHDTESPFFRGIGKMFVAAAIGASGMVLLIVAIIGNIIKFAS